MSDDLSHIYDANRSLARKRLLVELRFLVKWQAGTLFVAVLGLPFCTGFVLLTVLGIIAFLIPAIWAFCRLAEPSFFQFSLAYTPFLPDSIHYYAGFGIFLLPCLLALSARSIRRFWRLAFLLSPQIPQPLLLTPQTLTYILLTVFLFYCVIPQFFIARWLAKETENDTI